MQIKKKFFVTFCLTILIISVIFFAFLWRFERYTSDAYVQGNKVIITPLKPGFITAIHTDDTFYVKQGQLLFELDKTDAQIALNTAKDQLGDVVRIVCQTFYQVFAYQEEIEIKKAKYIKAKQDFDHRYEVLDIGGVSLEDYEHSVAALKVSESSLKEVENLYFKELTFIQNTTIATHPQVLQAAEKVKNAWVQLYRCAIYSPVHGIVAQRSAQVGMFVNPSEPLLSVLPLDQLWINANFKETQLKNMRIGQSVKLTSDLYGKDVIYHGKIVGLPGGAGNAFSLLPPQNLSGNWIKIVQRLPVRVALKDVVQIKRFPLRIGLSMHATVDIDNKSGPLISKSQKNTPSYSTSIFQKEEEGVEKIIINIIKKNTPSSLSTFIQKPFPCL